MIPQCRFSLISSGGTAAAGYLLCTPTTSPRDPRANRGEFFSKLSTRISRLLRPVGLRSLSVCPLQPVLVIGFRGVRQVVRHNFRSAPLASIYAAVLHARGADRQMLRGSEVPEKCGPGDGIPPPPTSLEPPLPRARKEMGTPMNQMPFPGTDRSGACRRTTVLRWPF